MSIMRTGCGIVGVGLMGLCACASGEGSPREQDISPQRGLSQEVCGVLANFSIALQSGENIDAARENMEAVDDAQLAGHRAAWQAVVDLSIQDDSPAGDAAYEANELQHAACGEFLPDPPTPTVSINPNYEAYFEPDQ